MKLGNLKLQPQGFHAFIPNRFPPEKGFAFSPEVTQKANLATFKLGELNGITQLLPDRDFFIFMYIRKDAASSSQIEGTRATMIDAIKAEAGALGNLPADVDDILHYIYALNFGLKRLEKIPLSLRLIREIHRELMQGARTSHFSDPGNFRRTQNWIGGSSLTNARFIPPPANEMNRALSDLENYLHQQDSTFTIIKAGLIHAQFETIHPFLDGNGRTGRMLITIFLHLEKLLDAPVLFLSSFFKQHQQLYYDELNNYRDDGIEQWLDFFLDGVIETADEALNTVRKINRLREADMLKIQSLGKTASQSAVKILPQLYKLPIVNVAKISKWTGFTRQGAQKVIDRFVKLGILSPKDETKKYGRSFAYNPYLDIFN